VAMLDLGRSRLVLGPEQGVELAENDHDHDHGSAPPRLSHVRRPWNDTEVRLDADRYFR
jgi:hypothetical protein